MEPRLIVFHDDEKVLQLFISAENKCIMEIPSNELREGLVHLMATYYVFGIEGPGVCKPILYFLQDIVMDKPDRKSRPTRYALYVARIQLH